MILELSLAFIAGIFSGALIITGRQRDDIGFMGIFGIVAFACLGFYGLHTFIELFM